MPSMSVLPIHQDLLVADLLGDDIGETEQFLLAAIHGLASLEPLSQFIRELGNGNLLFHVKPPVVYTASIDSSNPSRNNHLRNDR